MNSSDLVPSSASHAETGHALARRCAFALTSNPEKAAIEFNRQWLSWKELNQLADKI